MNYRYHLVDLDYVLSESEHKGCQEAYTKGQTIMNLRGGTLGINMSLVKAWEETYELTEPQEKERAKTLQLDAPEEKRVPNERLKEMSRAFKERMGWNK